MVERGEKKTRGGRVPVGGGGRLVRSPGCPGSGLGEKKSGCLKGKALIFNFIPCLGSSLRPGGELRQWEVFISPAGHTWDDLLIFHALKWVGLDPARLVSPGLGWSQP